MREGDILKDTIQFYSADPSRRSVSENNCYYLASDGRKCAVGRWLENPLLVQKFADKHKLSEIDRLVRNIEGDFQELFKEEARGFSLEFWIDLQDLHDYEAYWNASGLTDEGQLAYEEMLTNYDTSTKVSEEAHGNGTLPPMSE